jgi:hypothetical protein
MRLPEFTAGAALYRSRWYYYLVGTRATTGAAVLSQQLPISTPSQHFLYCELLNSLCNSGPASGNQYCTEYFQNCLTTSNQGGDSGGGSITCTFGPKGLRCVPTTGAAA